MTTPVEFDLNVESPEEVDYLLSAINALERPCLVICEKDWRFEMIFENIGNIITERKNKNNNDPIPDWEDFVIIFDYTRIGYGSFGLDCPDEIKLEKWKSGFGLIQFKRKIPNGKINVIRDINIRISAIPLLTCYRPSFIFECLEGLVICSRCLKNVKDFKTLEKENIYYCMKCYERYITIKTSKVVCEAIKNL